MSTFCCDSMDGLLEEAGNNGFSAIVGIPYLYLQMRSIKVSEESSMIELIRAAPITERVKIKSLTISSQICIKYCPFCGEEIEKKIAQNNGLALELEHKTRHLNLRKPLG